MGNSLHGAFQAQPVILYYRLDVAVVAVYPGFGVLKMRRHGLALNGSLQVSELHFHVDDASAAYRTPIRTLHVFVVAAMMDAVATPHEDNSLRRCEQVFATNGTIAVG